MTARMLGFLKTVLRQLPAALILCALVAVAWWGWAHDMKAPSLAALLGRAEDDKEKDKEEGGKGEGYDPDKPLPPVKLASEEALETAGIKTLPAVEERVRETVTANGTVDFNQKLYAHLAPRAAGNVWSVHRRAGDEVKKGDVLALVSAPEVGRLKFNLQQGLVQVDNRTRILRRLQSVAATNNIPPRQVQDAETSLREARLQVQTSQQSLANLGLSVRPDDLARLSDEEAAARLRTLGIPDSLLQDLEQAPPSSNLLPMVAPFDGMVVQSDIVVGEVVTTSTLLYVLADLRQVWLMLNVHLEDIAKVKVGQEVSFRPDGTDEDAPPAQVTWVSAQVDHPTHTVAARADVPNPGGRLRPHQFGTAHITIDRPRRVLVPTGALQWDGRSHLVFVQGQSATEFQPVRVRPGARHGGFTELLDQPDVKAGQKVAVAGSHVLLSEMLKARISGED